MAMYQIVLLALLLLNVMSSVLSLTPEDLSSPLLLLPHDNNCAINFGKDGTSGPFHGPEHVFYDGIRCKRKFSRNETTAFIVGETHFLKDVGDAAKEFGAILSLRARVLETGNASRNGAVKCGMRVMREILFLRATVNGTVNTRMKSFDVRQGGFYAFVDDSLRATQGKERENGTLCLFEGKIREDDYVSSSNVDSKPGKEVIGVIVGLVSGLVSIAMIVRYAIISST